MCRAVGKSGSPISRWMTGVPAASRALARASTSKADSVPSLPMRSASRKVVMPSMIGTAKFRDRPGPDGLAATERALAAGRGTAWNTGSMDAGQPLERAYREEATQIRAALAARTGDVGLAEDAVQDAFVEAIEHWARDGVPPSPGGWLAITARRKALDRLRRDKTGEGKLALLTRPDGAVPGECGLDIGGPGDAGQRADDELLGLVFACCDPALPQQARVAL